MARSRTRPMLGVLAAGLLVAVTWIAVGASHDTSPRPPAAPLVASDRASAPQLEAQGPELHGAPRAPRAETSEPLMPATAANDLQVTVLDANRRAVADLGVVVTARAGEKRQVVQSSRTDSQGRTLLTLLPSVLEAWRSQQAGTRFVVEAEVALPEPPEFDLGPDPGRHVPVVLRLPRAPRLEVEVVDEAGALIQELSMLYLFWRPVGADPTWLRVGQPSADVEDGRAHFEVVPPGLELLVRSTGTKRYHWAETVLPPQAADAGTVRARITLDVRRERVRVRLLDPEQRPLPNARVTVGTLVVPWDTETTSEPLRPPSNAAWADADAEGVLSLAIPMPAQPGRKRVLYVQRASTNPRTDERVPHLFALLPLEGRLRAGAEMDLGDLLLQAPTLLEVLAGRIVNEAGEPVAGATVNAEYEHLQYGVQHRQSVCAAVVTGADGVFALWSSRAPPGRIELRAFREGYRLGFVEATHGTRGIEVKLERR